MDATIPRQESNAECPEKLRDTNPPVKREMSQLVFDKFRKFSALLRTVRQEKIGTFSTSWLFCGQQSSQIWTLSKILEDSEANAVGTSPVTVVGRMLLLGLIAQKIDYPLVPVSGFHQFLISDKFLVGGAKLFHKFDTMVCSAFAENLLWRLDTILLYNRCFEVVNTKRNSCVTHHLSTLFWTFGIVSQYGIARVALYFTTYKGTYSQHVQCFY